MLSGIYQIYCKANGKYYIGSAKNIRNRLRQHRYKLSVNDHKNKHLQNAWNKYPESDFSFSAIYFCSVDLLLYFEQYFMDLIPKEKRFNICPIAGSNRGIKWRDESRIKLSMSQLGSSSKNKGRKHTIQSRLNMSLAHKGKPGKPMTEYNKRKLLEAKEKTYIVTTPRNEKIKVVNMAKFCRENNLSNSAMCKVAKGFQEYHKGYKVRYVPNPLS